MKLTEFITEIDDKDKKRKQTSLIAVVYENYRVIGTTSEVKVAINNYKESTGVDLLNAEVSTNYIAAAYGNIPQTYLAYIEKVAETHRDEESVADTVSE